MADSPLQFDRFCRSCRHSLRGFSSCKCSECGRAFDPDNPRTTATHEKRWVWFWKVLQYICSFLICICGLLVVFTFIASMIGVTGGMFLRLLAILVSPGLLFILLGIMLPWVPLSRRFRIWGVALLALFISIIWTEWPLWITFAFHRSAMNELADQAMAGENVILPQRVGVFSFHNIKQLENGNVGFQLTGGAWGGFFLVRCVPDVQYVWDWWDWQTNLGGGWYHVYED